MAWARIDLINELSSPENDAMERDFAISGGGMISESVRAGASFLLDDECFPPNLKSQLSSPLDGREATDVAFGKASYAMMLSSSSSQAVVAKLSGLGSKDGSVVTLMGKPLGESLRDS